MIFVIHGGAFLEDDAGGLVGAEHLFRTPAGVDDHAVLAGLATLLQGSRHDVFGLQREHGDGLGTAALGDPRRIDGHVAAANHDDLTACRL